MSAQGLGSRAIIGEFFQRLEQDEGNTWLPELSMLFNVDQETETYKFLGHSPTLREWIGGRNAKGFTENGISITNKVYEGTLEVLVDEIRRDKTGQVMVRIAELAARTNSHWASLISTLILNGAATVCYDGQFFFDTDHSEGDSGTQDNDLSIDISTLPAATAGTTTGPSPEEMSLSILQAIQAMVGFKDNQGEPMNENAMDFLVMTPISLMSAALSGVNALTFGGNATNIIQTSGFNIRVVGNARLSSWTEQFVVFRSDGQTKPFIRQEEDGVKVSAQAEGSAIEFNEKKHLYGVEAVRNVGYGQWQHACLVTMT